MREYTDTDPWFVVASIEAATALAGSWQCRHMDSIDDFMWNILGLRASACGFRTLATGMWNARDKPEDIRNNATLMKGRAEAADKKADALCASIDLPTKANGGRELFARVLWDKFRAIYVEVEHISFVMGLIGTAHWKADFNEYVPPHFFKDKLLMRYARDASEVILSGMSDYKIIRERWLVN